MNKAQLRKLALKHVKLRPLARRFDHLTGAELNQIDDEWFVTAVDNRNGLLLYLSRTGHQIQFPYDHIREFMSDTDRNCAGFLILKVQVHLQGDRARVEPLLLSNQN